MSNSCINDPAFCLRCSWISAIVAACFFLPDTAICQESPALRQQPLPLAKAIAKFELAESDVEIRCIASEPLVVDPVEAAFDDRGKLWVVEMQDYPYRVAETPKGRIKVLEDTDADGICDVASLFADELEMPTGLAIYREGVIVTVAGQLLFLCDTDDDGKADQREVWLSGFEQDNEQLRANHPRLGPDGWWYVACGLRGGKVAPGPGLLSNGTQNENRKPTILEIGSRDIRFDPATGSLQPITGPAQFGLTFNSLGNRLFCSNRNPCVQVVFEQEDLEGNPLVGLVPATRDIIPAGGDSRVYPLVDAWTTSNLHAGQFTAACGLFSQPLNQPAKDATSDPRIVDELFVCEPTGSLVKRERASRRAFCGELLKSGLPAETEWLASRDPWFRPVNLTSTPGGAILVVDMHRAVIEHPKWVPEELKNRPDERWGDQAGRLYAVSKNHDAFTNQLTQLRQNPLRSRSSMELAELAATSGSWQIEHIARILLERNATDVVPTLMAHVRNESLELSIRARSYQLAAALTNNAPSAAQLLTPYFQQSLSVGRGVSPQAVPRDLILTTLRAARRNNAVNADINNLLETLATTGDSAVLFETLLCMGTTSRASLSPRIWESIVLLDSPELLTAAAAALKSHPDRFLKGWINALEQQFPGNEQAPSVWMSTAATRLGRAVAKSSTSSSTLAEWLVERIVTSTNEQALLISMTALETMYRESGQEFSEDGALHVRQDFWVRIRGLASPVDSAASPSSQLRQAAIALLSHSLAAEDRRRLADWTRREQTPQIFATLLRGWSRANPDECEHFLLQLLESGTPQQREVAVDLIGHSKRSLQKVATELAVHHDLARKLGPVHLRQLRDRSRGPMRASFDHALASLVDDDRERILQRYQSCLQLAGDIERGKRLFSQHCASCHRIDDIGQNVGPDISDSRTKSREQLLVSILDPNRAIDNNYFRFVVLTSDDQVFEGIIAQETQDAIVIINQQNNRTVIARSDIVELKPTGLSLMPEGLESQVDQKGMADLLAFIKGWRYADAGVPLSDKNAFP